MATLSSRSGDGSELGGGWEISHLAFRASHPCKLGYIHHVFRPAFPAPRSVLLSIGLEELAAIHADELRHDTALLFEENLHFFRGLPLRPPTFFKDFDPTFCLSRVIVKAGFSLVIPDVGIPILPCFDLKSASRALVEIHATHGQFLPLPRLPGKLRYVGNAKWHISRKLDTGGDIPASYQGFNRFLSGSSALPSVNPRRS